MRIAITGATGFVGVHLTRALADQGHDLVLIARGTRGRIRRKDVTFVRADVVSADGLEAAFSGCDAVVHLVAIIKEKGPQTFDAVNRQGTANVARAARAAGVQHLVHLSAIGAHPDQKFVYLASKWAGEQSVRISGAPFSIIRSSLIFGPGDEFFTKLRALLRLTPFMLPIAGDGETQFQPIAAEDVTRCIALTLERGPSRGVVEIGGPDQLSSRQLLEIIADRFTTWPRVPIRMPQMALGVIAHVPNPFITPVQAKMLGKHNITRRHAVRQNFGFEPRSFVENCDYLRDY